MSFGSGVPVCTCCHPKGSMGKKSKAAEAPPLFDADEDKAEKVYIAQLIVCWRSSTASTCRNVPVSDELRACIVLCAQEAASSGAQLPSSAMGKYFSHPDKKLRDKAVAVFSKWVSKQEHLEDEDHVRIWKALFYCFWMSDKVPVQRELADRLAGLINACASQSQVCAPACIHVRAFGFRALRLSVPCLFAHPVPVPFCWALLCASPAPPHHLECATRTRIADT